MKGWEARIKGCLQPKGGKVRKTLSALRDFFGPALRETWQNLPDILMWAGVTAVVTPFHILPVIPVYLGFYFLTIIFRDCLGWLGGQVGRLVSWA